MFEKHERSYRAKWKPHKDSPHSFHSQKNKTFIAQGRKLSTVKQVFLAENSIMERHTLYRILSLVEYSLHTDTQLRENSA